MDKVVFVVEKLHSGRMILLDSYITGEDNAPKFSIRKLFKNRSISPPVITVYDQNIQNSTKKNYYFLAEEQEYDSEISRYLKLMSEDLERIASFKIDNLTKKDLEKCYNVLKNQFVIKVYNHNDFFFPRFSRKSKI